MSAFAAWAVAQTLKLLLFFVLERRINWRKLIETGGLPSAHSAFVMGLAIGIGIHDGFQSTAFAIAMVFALIVRYDALSLRREAGKHADILNELLLLSTIREALKEREALKQLLGHTPIEVAAGAAIGIGSALFISSRYA